MSWHQGVLEIKQFVRARESLVFIAIMPAGLMLLFGAIFDLDVGAPGVDAFVLRVGDDRCLLGFLFCLATFRWTTRDR